MPKITDSTPLKVTAPVPKDEVHITYKCSSCESEVVNITKSGTIYDRISCRYCANTYAQLRFMYPIIDNPRSGVKNAVISEELFDVKPKAPVVNLSYLISEELFDVKPKAPVVNLSYYCATCGQTSIKKYPNDGTSILDNSGMVCPVDNCGGWAEVTHWSTVWED